MCAAAKLASFRGKEYPILILVREEIFREYAGAKPAAKGKKNY